MSIATVSIVGRPNVGKSSLLNCLAGRRISIVDPTPGVTRDRVTTTIALGEGEQTRYVELVDTGGMGVEDVDRLTDHVENQIRFGISASRLILFVVDAREGVTPLDRHVAEQLRKQDKPVLLVANKIDEVTVHGEVGELNRLGFGEPVTISAIHNRDVDVLLDRMTDLLGDLPDTKPVPTSLKLAIVGKRNAGKSTLINALAGEQRVIVSEVAGTTRDSVDVTVEFEGKPLTLIDTAGVKKNRKIANDIEYYSQHRAMRSVRRADVVALMIDASTPVSQVDRSLAGVIAEEHKPVVIVVNKWDLAREKATPDEYAEYFEKTFPELSFAPISVTSAIENLNLHNTIGLARTLVEQARQRVGTGQLNAALEQILAKRGPSAKRGIKRPKIYYASQVDVGPPTIVCFVNDLAPFDQNYQRFLVNQFREYLPFPEVPIRIFFRQRRRDPRRG